jgi:hypothetical protein
MKRYLVLLAVAVVLGAIALVAGRRLRFSAGTEPAPKAPPEVALDLTITPDHRIDPATASVPKDHLVKLSVTNHEARAVSLSLMGYQDRFRAAYVGPDSVWRGEFVADRPGDDFAWVLEGAPVGRLAVSGSHLVDGHK